jgi:hypothetical protein
MPAANIYCELVPFGRAYQNIMGDLVVSPEAAGIRCIGLRHKLLIACEDPRAKFF